MRAASRGRLAIRTIFLILLGLLALPWPAQAAEVAEVAETVVTVVGTGDSQELLHILAQRFMRDNPDVRVEVPDSVGSTGGLRALLAGKTVFARTARPLREEEIAAGLVEVVFAKSPVVFAVNPSVTGVSGLTADQALAIYSGKINNWSELGGPDLPIARVCREIPETSRALLNAAIPGFEADGCRGQATAFTTPDAVAMTAEHPGAIGYFSLAAITATKLVPLAFNGVNPTPEHVGQGTYPLTIPFALAYKPPLPPAAERFLKSLASPDALSVMTRLGCLPILGKRAAP
ncbi:MAG: substrate-binding domain-containing protein [Acidobacteriota bacterium]